MIVLLVVIAALLGGLAGSWAARQRNGVGYVVIGRVLSQWSQFQQANEEFMDFVDELQREYKDALEEADETEKERIWQELQERMKNRNDEMVGPYDELLDQAMSEVRRQSGVSALLTTDSILVGGEDLTDAVIDYLTSNSSSR